MEKHWDFYTVDDLQLLLDIPRSTIHWYMKEDIKDDKLKLNSTKLTYKWRRRKVVSKDQLEDWINRMKNYNPSIVWISSLSEIDWSKISEEETSKSNKNNINDSYKKKSELTDENINDSNKASDEPTKKKIKPDTDFSNKAEELYNRMINDLQNEKEELKIKLENKIKEKEDAVENLNTKFNGVTLHYWMLKQMVLETQQDLLLLEQKKEKSDTVIWKMKTRFLTADEREGESDSTHQDSDYVVYKPKDKQTNEDSLNENIPKKREERPTVKDEEVNKIIELENMISKLTEEKDKPWILKRILLYKLW